MTNRNQMQKQGCEGEKGNNTGDGSLIDGDQLISQTWGNKSIAFQYDDTGSPYGFVYDDGSTEAVYYYVKNLQGDVIFVVTEGLEIIARYAYDAYGNHLYVKTGSGNDVSSNTTALAYINPIRYRGYYYDTETGFYYLQSRYYDPVVGRFLNVDGFVSTDAGFDGFNMYAYSGCNPVMYVDPSGTCYYANGKWTHDAWEFTGGYQRKSEPKYEHEPEPWCFYDSRVHNPRSPYREQIW